MKEQKLKKLIEKLIKEQGKADGPVLINPNITPNVNPVNPSNPDETSGDYCSEENAGNIPATTLFLLETSENSPIFSPYGEEINLTEPGVDTANLGSWGVGDNAGVILTYENQYCFGPISISNNWMCCSSLPNSSTANSANDSPSTIAPFIIDLPGVFTTNLQFDDGANWDMTINGQLYQYAEGLPCHCPNPTISEADEGTICDHSAQNDPTSAFNNFLDWHAGLNSSIGSAGGGAINGVTGATYPVFTSQCEYEAPPLITGACTDDGNQEWSPYPSFENLQLGQNIVSMAEGQPACNYVGNSDNFTGNLADYDSSNWTADCDYSCFGCIEPTALNQTTDSSITNLDVGECQYAACISPYADNFIGNDMLGIADWVPCNQITNMEDTGCEVCRYTEYCLDPNATNFICNYDYYSKMGDTGTQVALFVCDPDLSGPGLVGAVNVNQAFPSVDYSTEQACSYPDDTGDKTIGCTDPTAINYNSTAEESCIAGENNNYYPNACCIYEFCNDESAGDSYEQFHPSTTAENSNGPSAQFIPISLEEAQANSGLIDGTEIYFRGVQNNNLCGYEGCASSVGVPDQYQAGPGTMNPDIGPGTEVGFNSTDCDGTGIPLYYYHEDNEGCQSYDSTGSPIAGEYNADDTSCCVIPGCTDPNAENYGEYGDSQTNIPAWNGDFGFEGMVPTVAADSNGLPDFGACVEDQAALSLGIDLVPPGCEYSQLGCTDPNAINTTYVNGMIVTDDDGSCMYCQNVLAYQCDPPIPEIESQEFGGPIPGAFNAPVTIDCLAIWQGGQQLPPQPGDSFIGEQVIYEIPGCADPNSCNYNPDACPGEDCEYPEPGYDCDGVCLNDEDGDGICDEFEVSIQGCPDPEANNYYCDNPTEGYECDFGGGFPEEVIEDSSVCVYPIEGCTDETANNYNPEAEIDDGSCDYGGCVCCPQYSANIDNYSLLTTHAQYGGQLLGGTLTDEICADEGGCEGIYGGYCYPAGLGSDNTADHCDQLVSIRIQNGGSHNMTNSPNTPPRYGWFGYPLCNPVVPFGSNNEGSCANGTQLPSYPFTVGSGGWYDNQYNNKVQLAMIYCKSPQGNVARDWYEEGQNTYALNYDYARNYMCAQSYCATNPGWSALGCSNQNTCTSQCASHEGGPWQFRYEGCE